MDQAVKRELTRAAGRDNFNDSPKVRWVYGSDATGRRHPPEAVVRAIDTAQVSRILAVCQALFMCVTTMAIATTPLAGHALLGVDKTLATLPLVLNHVGIMTMTIPNCMPTGTVRRKSRVTSCGAAFVAIS